jgi:thymidylate kinase
MFPTLPTLSFSQALSQFLLLQNMLTLNRNSAAARQFPSLLQLAEQWQGLPSSRTTKVIVVEGLDGCGKSELVGRLSSSLQIPQEYSLHPEMREHRHAFDSMDETEKRQFYLLGNEALMAELQRPEYRAPVCILDRSYATTLSYHYGHLTAEGETSIEQLLSKPIRWPTKLKPDLYIILHCEESERIRRLNRRGQQTQEETLLATNERFRSSIKYCLENFEDSHVIDTTDLTPKNVYTMAYNLIKKIL